MSQPITKDMIIGDMLQRYPETKPVLIRYFGTGCFSCPGMYMESLSFGATMHNVDVETLVAELNAAVEGGEQD